MTPEQELVNYINGWIAKGTSRADLVTLLRAKADELDETGAASTDEDTTKVDTSEVETEGQTETEGSTEGDESEE